MLNCVDDHEKILINVCDRYNVSGINTRNNSTSNRGNPNKWFLTEYGLYEVLFQSRKPIAKSFKMRVKRILKDLRLHGKVEQEFDFDNMFIPIDIQKDFQALNDLREDHGRGLFTLEEYLDTIGMTIDPESKRIIPVRQCYNQKKIWRVFIMNCKHETNCRLYLAGLCVNKNIENKEPVSVENFVKCKMADFKLSAQN